MRRATRGAHAATDSDLVWDDPEFAALERQRREHLSVEAELRAMSVLLFIYAVMLGLLLATRSVKVGLAWSDLALLVAPFIAATAAVQLRRLRPSGRLVFAIGGSVAYALYVPFISGVTWYEWVGHISVLSLLIQRLWRPGVATVLSSTYRRRVMRVTPHLEPSTSPLVTAALGLLALAGVSIAALALARWLS